ncbi:MAG: hypothetical protein RLZ12_167 [Bacillota bacterium]|jgi:translation initiation factor IF-2
MRVYEYAKTKKISSKEVLQILQRLSIDIKSHMSILDEATVKKIEVFFARIKQSVPKKQVGVLSISAIESGANNNNNKSDSIDRKENFNQQPNKKIDKPLEQKSRVKPVNTSQKTHTTPNQRPQKNIGGFKPRTGAGYAGKRNERHSRFKKFKKPIKKIAPVLPKEIEVNGSLAVSEFAKLMRQEANAVIKKLMDIGVILTLNQYVDVETMSVIADEYGIKLNYKELVDESKFENIAEIDSEEDLVTRPPIVTIMGHVDHGKTTLLDFIRKTNVIAKEAGGITQHIGAYQVSHNAQKITFLDTPGHAAFTAIRARGAQLTDMTVLVVAADDGVMPQTIEAINHAKAANIPIIIAISKIDKPGANLEKIKNQLSEQGLVPEEWGGDVLFVPISVKTNTGINDLLDSILLVAEMQEYRANPKKRARGVVVEARLDKDCGPIATVLVQNGILNVGDNIVAGNYFGKIRAMLSDVGLKINDALPSTPAEILGLSGVPDAGDHFLVYSSEKQARLIAEKRMFRQRTKEQADNKKPTVEDLFKRIQGGDFKELNVIIKADVHGSSEALKSSLDKINIDGVKVKTIHTGVGAITESDILLASASGAIIVGFNVRPKPNVQMIAKQEGVDIRLHRIIYKVIEEIETAMKGLLDPVLEEKVIGTASVRKIFKASKIGTIAGCYVTEGKVSQNAQLRLIRDGVVLHEGELKSLKRGTDDVKEVMQGYECGLTVVNYQDIKPDDVFEFFIEQEVEV